MSRFLKTTALTLALALGAGPAFSAGAAKSGATQTQSSAAGASQTQKQVRADQVIGSKLYDSQGKEVGEIEDLVINRDDEVTYAIVDVGGFLGMGERQVALPFDQLAARDGDTLMMSESMDEDALRGMRVYERSEAYEGLAEDEMLLWPQGQRKATP